MSYPQQTFDTFAELLAYINNYIITNGDQEIDGVEMNSVVNALLTFIEQSPLNYQKALLISAGGNVVTSQPVVVITGVTPTSINWSDNIYNQNIIINTTGAIPLPNGVFYYNAALQPQSSIPAQSVINIVKASNSLWIQTNQGSSGGLIKPPIAGTVGGAGMPIGGTSVYTDSRLIGLGSANNGNIQIVIAEQILSNYGANSSFVLNNVAGTISLDFGNVFNTGDSFYCNTNQ